jgi:flagellar protein FlgJ
VDIKNVNARPRLSSGSTLPVSYGTNPGGALAADARSLDRLRLEASRDPAAAVKGASSQFEAIFMQQVLKSMREASPKSGLMEGSGHELYTSMLDQQLSQTLSGKPGGLSEVIARQLGKSMSARADNQKKEPSQIPPVQGSAPRVTSAVSPSSSDAAVSPGEASATKAASDVKGEGLSRASNPMLIQAIDAAASLDPIEHLPDPIASVDPVPPGGNGFEVADTRELLFHRLATPSAQMNASDQTRAGPGGISMSDSIRSASSKSKSSTTQSDFVQKIWPHAVLAQNSTGVPAAFVVGQAALESGWGRSEIPGPGGTRTYNLFGIKAGAGWKGPTVDATTTEYVNGKPVKTVEKFRAYASYAEAFRDWSSLMSNNPRYEQVLKASASVEGFAGGMQRAGYATDPQYGRKLAGTINLALSLRGTPSA